MRILGTGSCSGGGLPGPCRPSTGATANPKRKGAARAPSLAVQSAAAAADGCAPARIRSPTRPSSARLARCSQPDNRARRMKVCSACGCSLAHSRLSGTRFHRKRLSRHHNIGARINDLGYTVSCFAFASASFLTRSAIAERTCVRVNCSNGPLYSSRSGKGLICCTASRRISL